MKTNHGIRPRRGQAYVCRDGLTMEPDVLTGADVGGFTAAQVLFGASDGSATGSANLTWNGSTFAVTGAVTIGTTLNVTGVLTTVVGASFGSDIGVAGMVLPNNSVSAYLNGAQGAVYGSTGSGSFPFNQSGNLVLEARGGANPRAVVLASAGGSFTAYLDSVGTFNVPSTTASTSTSTGALVVSGGAGIGGALYVGGLVSFTNTTDASDYLTAGLVLGGGLAAKGSIYLGAFNSSGTSVSVNSSDSTGSYFKMLATNVLRWQFGRVGTTHDWRIEGYDSSGVLTDIPLTIANAAAGAFTIVRPVTIGSTLGVTGVASLSGGATIGTGSGTAFALLAGGSGSAKFLRVYTGNDTTTGHLRWDFGAAGDAESGANAGSTFQIVAYGDTGGFIDSPVTITRVAGGAMTLSRPVTMSSTLAVTGTGSFGDTLTVSKDQAGAYTHFDVVNPNAGGYAQTNLTAQGKTAGTNWAPGLFYKFTTPTTDPIVFEVNGVEVVRFTTGGLTIASGDVLTLGNAYVATPQVGTGYVTLKDSTGTVYKVLVAA